MLARTLLMTALLFSGAADAQNAPRVPCHKTSEVVKQLEDKYGEHPVAFGFQSNGNLLQIYTSPETGSWTAITSTPDGMSCIIAAGKRWEQIPIVPEGPMA